MQLTRAADYAVRVMVHLAGLPPGTRASRPALAEAADVPEEFLSKVLQSLARARLVVSHRGATGGFELAVDADSMTLLDVVEAIEGPLHLNFCLAGVGACKRSRWCAAHVVWADAQRAMAAVLKRATIFQLAQDSAANKWALHEIAI